MIIKLMEEYTKRGNCILLKLKIKMVFMLLKKIALN